MRHLIFSAMTLAGVAAASEPHVPVIWPLDVCEPARVQKASPAPLPNDSAALNSIPFSMSFLPYSASVLIRLTPDYRAVIECVVDEGEFNGFELVAAETLADVVFSAPIAVNTAEEGGLYVARVSTYWGISSVAPPPPLPILPACAGAQQGGAPRRMMPPNAPKPASRVPAAYPELALLPGVEGDVVAVLDIFTDGTAIPKCIASASPPGWFEKSSIDALSLWRFQPGTERGLYTVTIKYRMEN